ncbi:stromelysin-3 isoform X1 [Patella vulgata]|uniref:stromelysin-3 isoform X1 n=1 Tax=Patella vulgata TaxID=6465 RepID=UPI0024A7D235|nr:stromelysin-3 isoform X1 [Patella vulgata]
MIGHTIIFIAICLASTCTFLVESHPDHDCSSCIGNIHRPRNAIAATDILRRYGYLKDSCYFNPVQSSYRNAVLEAIIIFQEYNDLKITGKLDKETLDFMGKSRCGVPDILDDVQVTIVSKRRRGKRQSPVAEQRWRKTDLTYRITSYCDDLSATEVDLIIREAWKIWSDVIPLTFTQVGPSVSDADMDISFARGVHGDSDPFDGPGGVVAHAFYPGGPEIPLSGDTHFDDAEQWTYGKEPTGRRLLCSAVHEFGHTLGLKHTNRKDSIMYPWSEDCGTPKLSDYDMVIIQGIYGMNNKTGMTPSPDFNMSATTETTLRTNGITLTPETEPTFTTPFTSQEPVCTTTVINTCTTEAGTTTTTVETTEASMTTSKITNATFIMMNVTEATPTTSSPTMTTGAARSTPATTQRPECPKDGKLDAIDVAPDGKTYGFKGNKIYIFHDNGVVKGSPFLISKIFRNGPSYVDAAVTIARSFLKPARIYLFQGEKVWKYQYLKFRGHYGYSLRRGYPKLIKSKFGIHLKKIDAAFKLKSSKWTFFAEGGKLWPIKFRTFGNPRVSKPIPFASHPTLSHLKKLDAAFKWTNGAYYFFEGDYYHRLVPDGKKGHWNHPRFSLLWWFNCKIPGTEQYQRLAGDLSDKKYSKTVNMKDL